MTVLLIRCGRVGGALARAWVATHRVLAFDPVADALPAEAEHVTSLDRVAARCCSTAVLAVKPQTFPSTARRLRTLAQGGALFVSIMTGVLLSTLQPELGSGRVARAIPNTPAAVGRGMTAAVRESGLRHDDAAVVDRLLARVGQVAWLVAESQLDLVTAVSGSGPAYLFRLAEASAMVGAATAPSRVLAEKK